MVLLSILTDVSILVLVTDTFFAVSDRVLLLVMIVILPGSVLKT